MGDLTRYLNESQDDREVCSELYAELKKIARSRMRGEREDHTLNPTALVNEAWLRLEKSAADQWRDRKQFYGAAAEAMRRILVESARRRLAAKRGGGRGALPWEDELPVAAPLSDQRLIGVHEVLDQLEAEEAMNAQIVKLRFFAGMKNEEIAGLLDVSITTVKRRWAVAKLWLYEALMAED